jgi:hypothetical protein
MDELKHAVQALAQDADTQHGMFPSFVLPADQMAVDFECAYERTKKSCINGWSYVQVQALKELDLLLAGLSGDRPEIWIDEGCLDHPQWARIRVKAQEVLTAFGWEKSPASKNTAIYVGSEPAT